MSKKSFHDIMNANSAFQNHIEVGIHNFLHSRYFVIPISMLIFVDLITVIMQTFSWMQLYSAVFNLISLISACVFTAEYVARLYSAPAEMPLLNTLHARIKYAFSFLGLIDLICIAPFVFRYLYRTHMIKEFVDIALILLIFTFFPYPNSYPMLRDVITSVPQDILHELN